MRTNTSKKDGLVEDLIEDFVIEFGSDSDDEEELIDYDDRQLIDNALCSTTTMDITDTIQNLDPDFCNRELPV